MMWIRNPVFHRDKKEDKDRQQFCSFGGRKIRAFPLENFHFLNSIR